MIPSLRQYNLDQVQRVSTCNFLNVLPLIATLSTEITGGVSASIKTPLGICRMLSLFRTNIKGEILKYCFLLISFV